MPLNWGSEWKLLQANGVFGLLPFEGRWTKNRQDKQLSQGYNFVYNFKAHGQNPALVEALIRAAAEMLGCDAIVAVPSSSPGPNSLQKIFGESIIRLYKVEKVKYKSGTYSFDEASVAVRPPAGRVVMLVDDVCTTGQTMTFFEKKLLACGVERVVKFVIGLNAKLNPATAQNGNGQDITLKLEKPKEAELEEWDTPVESILIKPGPGRPAALIDWKAVDRLLQAGCMGTQIAARLGIHPETLYDNCKREYKTDFSDYSRQKKEHGETLLHEQQFKAAMNGNISMLVWLGKQRLGQKERSANENETTVKVMQAEVVIRSSGVPLATDEKDED